jgi:hypothetical protein
MRPNPETDEHIYPFRYNTYQNGVKITNDNGTTWELGYKRYWEGTKTPGYPKVKRNNPHLSYINQWKPSVSTFRDINYSDPSNKYVSIAEWPLSAARISVPSECPYSLIGLAHDPYVMRKALDAAMDQVKDMKVNFAQFIAEREQVVNMVNDVVKRITTAITSIRRRDFRSATAALGLSSNPRNLSHSVASNWLAYQYGWKPLLSDVKGFAEHFARNAGGRPQMIRVSVKRSAKSSIWLGSGTNSYGGPVRLSFGERTTNARVGLEFSVTNDLHRQGSELGISDPLLLAWELLPYSFVVDWFLPIGNFLQRLNYDSGLSFVTGYTVLFSTQSGSANNVAKDTSNGVTGRIYDGSGDLSWKHSALNRDVLSSPPRPVLPSFKDPFSPVHTLNALALMRTAFGR